MVLPVYPVSLGPVLAYDELTAADVYLVVHVSPNRHWTGCLAPSSGRGWHVPQTHPGSAGPHTDCPGSP